MSKWRSIWKGSFLLLSAINWVSFIWCCVMSGFSLLSWLEKNFIVEGDIIIIVQLFTAWVTVYVTKLLTVRLIRLDKSPFFKFLYKAFHCNHFFIFCLKLSRFWKSCIDPETIYLRTFIDFNSQGFAYSSKSFTLFWEKLILLTAVFFPWAQCWKPDEF